MMHLRIFRYGEEPTASSLIVCCLLRKLWLHPIRTNHGRVSLNACGDCYYVDCQNKYYCRKLEIEVTISEQTVHGERGTYGYYIGGE
jgi:hypothetical protein